jgi:hypothetical protein
MTTVTDTSARRRHARGGVRGNTSSRDSARTDDSVAAVSAQNRSFTVPVCLPVELSFAFETCHRRFGGLTRDNPIELKAPEVPDHVDASCNSVDLIVERAHSKRLKESSYALETVCLWAVGSRFSQLLVVTLAGSDKPKLTQAYATQGL